MGRNKIKYILGAIKNYLELVVVIYLVYTFVNGIIGYELKFCFHGSSYTFIAYDLTAFYTNSLMHHVQVVGQWNNPAFVQDLTNRYSWVLTLEIIFIIIVPILIIIGLELKKHNTKVRYFIDKRKAKSTEKKKIKLEKQLNDLKDKEL